MKLSEIRNKMFGLSDLRGLIKENSFDEGRGAGSADWAAYFKANPERLNLKLTDALGLPSVPKTPLTIDQVGDSEMRRHFGDDFVARIIADPNNFVKDKGFSNIYKNARMRNRAIAQSSESGIEVLKQFFDENGGNQIDNSPIVAFEQNPNREGFDSSVLDYFYSIKNLAESAGKLVEENGINRFNDTGIVVGEVENPFSMFLYFFFNMYILRSGVHYNYDNNIRPEFKPYIARVMYDVKGAENDTIGGGDSIPSIIQSYLLEPIGLKYTSELYKYSDTLYNSYFADRSGIEKLESLLGEMPKTNLPFQGAAGVNGRMGGTVGSVVYYALAILNASDSSQKRLIEQIGTFMGGAEMAKFRSAAYLGRYEMKTNQVIDEEFKKKMCECFLSSDFNAFFDPLVVISYKNIEDGLRKWIEIGDITQLTKSILNVSADDTEMCPAEKIFSTARSIKALLESNYGKYGAGPGRYEMNIGLLLGDANEGLKFWQSLNPTNKIPTAQNRLMVMYNKERGEKPDEELSFWRILSRDNTIKDVTQTQIYLWLVDHTDDSVKWTYEYNRNETIDDELGGKSIDILAKTDSGTLCFEYQGEQHYRPLTVKYEEYTKFPLFTRMRDYILNECGFEGKTVGNSMFYTGPENADATRMYEIRKIILGAYRKFYREVLDDTYQDKLTGRALAEGFVPAVNKKAEFKNSGEVLAYFQSIISKGPNDLEIFENPPIDGLIPYLGSPRRFLDEIKTAQDMGRDITKSQIIHNRNNTGWKISYIIPGNARKDEEKYTSEQLAGSNAQVFRWNKLGKDRLLQFLSMNGLRKDVKTDSPEGTLFEEIVKELILGGFR